MDITRLPFNAHVGIERSTREDRLLQLTQAEEHGNHLGTVHASALFALAEATSGEFLISSRKGRTDVGGVVRKSSSKYSRPASGVVYSRVTTPLADIEAAMETVESRGRALTEINVELTDAEEQVVANFQFIWLIARESGKAK